MEKWKMGAVLDLKYVIGNLEAGIFSIAW